MRVWKTPNLLLRKHGLAEPCPGGPFEGVIRRLLSALKFGSLRVMEWEAHQGRKDMRVAVAVLVTAVLAAVVTGGVIYQLMEARAERVKVSSFNDGFTDGACHLGQDGFGTPCR